MKLYNWLTEGSHLKQLTDYAQYQFLFSSIICVCGFSHFDRNGNNNKIHTSCVSCFYCLLFILGISYVLHIRRKYLLSLRLILYKNFMVKRKRIKTGMIAVGCWCNIAFTVTFIRVYKMFEHFCIQLNRWSKVIPCTRHDLTIGLRARHSKFQFV